MSQPKIISFGEVLWDMLPTGKVVGGAPLNVAFHLKNLGGQVALVSQVGHDNLGIELLGFLKENGIETSHIGTNHTFQTGIVNVRLNQHGSPSYEIAEPAAWDYIHLTDEMIDAVRKADALVFGSLVCRCGRSKQTLLEMAKYATFKVFDVNLRPPFYTQTLIEELLEIADVVKMSDEEMDIIARWYLKRFDEEKAMIFIQEKFALETLILTKGSKGAACLSDGKIYSQPALKIEIKDTIGSGDTFLAAFLQKMFEWKSVQACLEFACAAGALVATKNGGTPKINEQEILSFLQSHKEQTTST